MLQQVSHCGKLLVNPNDDDEIGIVDHCFRHVRICMVVLAGAGCPGRVLIYTCPGMGGILTPADTGRVDAIHSVFPKNSSRTSRSIAAKLHLTFKQVYIFSDNFKTVPTYDNL